MNTQRATPDDKHNVVATQTPAEGKKPGNGAAGVPPPRVGRPPGTPNKIGAMVREMMGQLVQHNMGYVQQALDAVRDGMIGEVEISPGVVLRKYVVAPDPKGYVELITRLGAFVAPTLKAVDATIKDDRPPADEITAPVTAEAAQAAYLKLVS